MEQSDLNYIFASLNSLLTFAATLAISNGGEVLTFLPWNNHFIFCNIFLCSLEFMSCYLQVLTLLNVDHLPPEEDNRHVLRVGFSAGSASIQLGKILNYCFLPIGPESKKT